jgi:hypothetical protein
MQLLKRMLLLTWLVMLPASAYAQQATITGVVKDASGAVLPGVTVEASSEVLIEKVRTAVTDGTGQYRIVDLRPGTYAVTFALPGFSTVKREGIELTGTFVASVNAELKVGQVTETITVSGETPIVDVQSVRRQNTLTNELLTTVPNARSWAAIAVLFQGITIQAGTSADVQVTPQMTVFGGAGGRTNEGRMQVDGLGTGAALNGGGVSTYVADISNAQEVVTTNSGGLGEAEVGGPAMNIVPKSGGNTLKGQVYLSGVPGSWVGNNYTQELKDAGLSTPGKLLKQWDETFGLGGPIKRDRLWYYVTYRDEGQHRSIPGIFPNLNAGDPSKWEYLPDLTKQARGAESFQVGSVRLTAQVTPKNKVNFHWDMQWPCNGAAFTEGGDACRDQSSPDAFYGSLGLGGLTAISSPETAGYLRTLVQNHQVTWQSPTTNRLLLEAGVGSYRAAWGPFEMPGNPTRGLARVTESTARNSAVANFSYRSANWAEDFDNPNRWRFSASYVTGAHNMKFGYDGSYLVEDIQNFGNDLNLAYTFTNGRPSSLTESLRVYTQSDRVRTTGLYAQDQWTYKRMTLQGAVRYDNAWSYSPPQTIGPALINGQTFLGTPLTFDRTDGVNFKDISPRGGMALDVFGNGRTALKVNVGKYMDPASNLNGNYSISNPIARIATTANRTWTDGGIPGVPGTAGDFIPQCDLTNNAANGECAATTATTFGTATRTTAAIDQNLLVGWGVRPRDWQFGVSVQQQVLPRVSVEVGYLKRWLQNFTATDNLEVAPSDFTPFSITAPSDPRLPNGGNYSVDGLFNVVQGKFGRTSNSIGLTTLQTQSFNGLLASVTARVRNGLTLQAGINSGSQVTDYCGLRAELTELTLPAAPGPLQGSIVSPTNPYCRVAPGLVTKVSGVGSYTIPKIDVQVAGTIRSDQGAPLRAIYNAPVALVSAALGRPAAVAGTFVPIDLVAPGDVWGDRVNEVDLRVAKILRFGRTRTNVGVDMFNLINSSAVLTYNQVYAVNGPWLAPQSIITPRFFKVSAQIDF